MSMQNLLDVSRMISGIPNHHTYVISFLDAQKEIDGDTSTISFLNYLHDLEDIPEIKKKSEYFIKKIDSQYKEEEGIERLFKFIDRMFSMNALLWVINNYGNQVDLTKIKLHKIAFTTNYYEAMDNRKLLGFGETFTAYKYGPWSFDLMLDLQMLQATDMLKPIRGFKTNQGKNEHVCNFENELNSTPHGRAFIKNLEKTSNEFAFIDDDNFVKYYYDHFPIFYKIRDTGRIVSQRQNGEIWMYEKIKMVGENNE